MGKDGTISANGAVTVGASTTDYMILFAVAIGAASTVGVAGGVNAALFMNHVNAYLGGTITKSTSLSVTADTTVTFINTAVGFGGAGTVGVAAVFVVSYLYNETNAYILADADITSSGSALIQATSSEVVVAVVAGGGAAGVVGVSGTVNVAVTQVKTRAYTEDSVKITAASVKIAASDTFQLVGVAGALGGAGTVGIGISGTVVVAFNTIEAAIGTNNIITSTSGGIEVLATSSRDLDAYTRDRGRGRVRRRIGRGDRARRGQPAD